MLARGFSHKIADKKNFFIPPPCLKQPFLQKKSSEETSLFNGLNSSPPLNASEEEASLIDKAQSEPQAQQPSQHQQNVIPNSIATLKSYLTQNASHLQKAFAKTNKKDFVLLLSKVENLNKLSLEDIFKAIGFGDEEDQTNAISKLFEGLFTPKGDSLSLALDMVLDSRESAGTQQEVTLVITFLCYEFKRLNEIKDEVPPFVSNLEALQGEPAKILSAGKNNFKIEQKKLVEKQIELIFKCRDMYYKYDKVEHKLTPGFDRENSSTLISIINGQEKSLKQVYKSIKGVKSLDQDKLFSSMDALGLAIATNFATDIGPFTDAVVGHYDGTENSVAQDVNGLLYNVACFLGAAFLSSLWRSRGRNPEKYLQDLARIITKSLNKSVGMCKQIKAEEEVDAKTKPLHFPELSARLKKYNAKMNSSFLFKLKKIFKLNLFSRSPSRPLLSSYVLGNRPIKPVLAQTRSEQNRFHPSLHFDKVSQLKETILRFEQTRNISSFLEELSSYEFLDDENFTHDTVFKLKFRHKDFRGNIIQQLTNIYRRSSDISGQQKQELRELIQRLNRTGATDLGKALDENKKIILQTNWQNRVKSCLSAHQISLNILNNEIISAGDKKFIFKCLIEDLKDKENGPMAGLCERRDKAAFEFGVSAVGYQAFAVKRYLPLLSHAGLPNSDAAKAAFGELGWLLYAFLSSLGTLLVNSETTTWNSILSSFKGSLQLLEDEELHSNSPSKSSMDSSTKEILSIVKNKGKHDNKGKFKPQAVTDLFKILKDLISEQDGDSTALKFILEHKHGLKKPLLFEILKRIPDNSINKKNLLKMYFTKENFRNFHQSDQANLSKNDFDKFNQFLIDGIEQTKSSKNQTAFLVLQAKSYLLHLRSELAELDKNDADYSTKFALYQACKKRLADVVTNTRKDQYSEFRALRQRSLISAYTIKSFIKSVGMLVWAFGCFMSTSAAAVGVTGLCIGANIVMPGVGLAAAIVILIAFGIFRTLTSAVSNDHPHTSHTDTNTFKLIKNELNIPKEAHHKAIRDSTEKLNDELIEYLSSTTHDLQTIDSEVNKKLKGQIIDLFGCNLDQEKINLIQQQYSQGEKKQLFKRIKEDILAQSVDKETILASLLRVIFIINESDLESFEKLAELEILFKDILNDNGVFGKLRLEQDYTTQKNWFVPQVMLGGLYGLAPLSVVLQQANWEQVLMATTADVFPCYVNGTTRFSSPKGNTKSFQESILLIKNVMALLLASGANEDKSEEELKKEEGLKRLLNHKTSRIKIFNSKAKSTPQILERLINKAPAPAVV